MFAFKQPRWASGTQGHARKTIDVVDWYVDITRKELSTKFRSWGILFYSRGCQGWVSPSGIQSSLKLVFTINFPPERNPPLTFKKVWLRPTRSLKMPWPNSPTSRFKPSTSTLNRPTFPQPQCKLSWKPKVKTKLQIWNRLVRNKSSWDRTRTCKICPLMRIQRRWNKRFTSSQWQFETKMCATWIRIMWWTQ